MRKLPLAAVVLAAATFGLAGCGIGGPAESSSKPPKDVYDKMVKYAQCLQQQGVDVEIPDPNKPAGPAKIRDPNNSAPDPKMQAAESACAKFAPSNKGEDVPAAEQDHAVKMAECLRKQGIDAKDPAPGTARVIVDETGGNTQRKLVAAYTTCNKQVPAPTG